MTNAITAAALPKPGNNRETQAPNYSWKDVVARVHVAAFVILALGAFVMTCLGATILFTAGLSNTMGLVQVAVGLLVLSILPHLLQIKLDYSKNPEQISLASPIKMASLKNASKALENSEELEMDFRQAYQKNQEALVAAMVDGSQENINRAFEAGQVYQRALKAYQDNQARVKAHLNEAKA